MLKNISLITLWAIGSPFIAIGFLYAIIKVLFAFGVDIAEIVLSSIVD